MDLTRATLESIVRPVIDRCRAPVAQAMKDANVKPEQIDRIVFVGGPTRMPIVRKYFEDFFGRKAEMGVDPMECVASGAAIQAGVLSGTVGGIVLVDVTPLTLSVETLGGIATPLVKRNTPVPVKLSEVFTTAADSQTAVTVHVVQGERAMAADNISLGQFNLDGLAPAPKGVPKVEITFDIDSNGILNATAKDLATSKSQSIRITGSTRLSDEDKKRMVSDAERYAEEDRKRREQAAKLNDADSACYEGERMLSQFGQQLSAEQKSKIETATKEVREAREKKEEALAIQRAEALRKILQAAGAEIYAKAGAESQKTKPGPSDKEGKEKVVDAEYFEDKKKAG